MTRDNVPVTKICDVVGCSRTTYYNWKNAGELTDGVPWDEWLEDHSTFEMARVGNEQLEVSVEKKDEFWEHNIPKLRKAVQKTINKMEKGEILLSPDDLETIVGLMRRVENRGKELRMLQEEFMRKVFFAVREEVDKHKFQAIKEKVKQISLEQLRDVDEDYAATVIDEAA